MSAPAPVDGLVALLDLGRRARAATDSRQLGFVVVNESRRVLDYRQAALWLGGQGGRVAALSGVPRADPAAPYVQWLTRLFRQQRPPIAPAPLGAGEVSASVGADWQTWLPASALLVPLAGHGMLLLARDRAWTDDEQAVAGEIAGLYAHAFSALARRNRGWKRVRLPRLAIVGGIILLVAALGLIPVRLSTLAPAEIGARDALAVKSPLTGAIDRLAVRPSQPVSAGDLLFELDATALRSEYEAAERSYQAALAAYQQSAQLAVTDDKAKAEVARYRGEAEAMAVALNFGAEQLARTRISAPRDGVAVFADVNALTGKAVTLGELVMTIADPAKVELVVEMPAGDQIPVTPGAAVEFYPDATPFTTYPAHVETVAYRAGITPSGVLAFRVVARLAGEESPPLGMLGSARIYAGEVPLAYAIFRRPLATLRQWLGI